MDELKQRLELLRDNLKQLAVQLNFSQKKAEIVRLQQIMTEPDFWQDEAGAREKTKHLADLEEEVSGVEQLARQVDEQLELLAMTEGDDAGMRSDLFEKTQELEKIYKTMEIRLFLHGEYDAGNAIVSIHSGQGGTEACDWAQMLRRMYVRLFERKQWKFDLIEESLGEEAGIKSATYMVRGTRAYGYLKGEAGTHRLVRQSPFNADNLRQTSFALVEVLPEIGETKAIEIRDEDLEWAFFRSGGHGGQNVNKVNTAVRLKHIPSGLVIESQTQRYQEQNRKLALDVLKAKLWQQEEANRKEELDSLKGQKMASWGSQIRSYVLHPYHLVKDVRTNVETSDAEAVLDGDLDEFIEAEIRLSN